ncbi:MAG: transporter substrate-binding domain-containing protein [Agarilytica sp.]
MSTTAVRAGAVAAVYPKPSTEHPLLNGYPIELLRMALTKAQAPYVLIPSFKSLPKNRALFRLKNREGIDVLWSDTNSHKEKDFYPIKIPIYKGLSGWRIPLVNKHRSIPTSQILSFDKLKQYSLIQGSDWPGRKVFEANHIVVHHAYEQASLYEMLGRNRGDMLFQSVVELSGQENKHRYYGLKIDDNIAVRYPSAVYFFVHKDNHALAEAIQKGLFKSISDGSFDALFEKSLTPFLKSCHLDERTILDIDNPNVPEAMQLGDQALWYRLEDDL